MNLEELMKLSDEELEKLVKDRVDALMETYTPPDIDQLTRFVCVNAFGPFAFSMPQVHDKVKATLQTDPKSCKQFMDAHRALQHNVYVESTLLEIANEAMTEALGGNTDA